ncbi:solute carrier family 29 (equilibrative nucleoside transporter), member 1/2/3 [Coccidioides immitis RS]|uniref:Solute carrier family 29 (Equilibrative nucleoside transporter), member 1/2/3 n=3 Tax=Coccidioides immitis TaxID=5501 RepID=A0A0D8JUQ8_COCIM|nr:solute carrier family 29 (equilibrative nucleoside transporter), member 1/2/3 [Coccidioides immitis RS]KJF60013.1 solute carrier family 29 (equilibrative nucleoside transporter), member 1/2/3 [Coccidioides immitis RS]KMU81101.1 hypothetical protein CISG_02479 [Coccidioides immitis RMSCC 3703]KMU86518.1 hypothetical protein CIHG_04307 [Coccidioides immitis H538.4]TPX24911.1 hypothetical protein DIZ76_010355 [Coccidioides immitis]
MASSSVTVHALRAGRFTIPEHIFVTGASELDRKTVPSLAFLIQHHNISTGKTTRIVFDLGLRRDIRRYPAPIERHLRTRQPLETDPDVVKSLAAGGLSPNDIDYVHWDHVGEPRDFTRSTFVVGYGSLDLLRGKIPAPRGSHTIFEHDLIPHDRTVQLLDPGISDTGLNLNEPNSEESPGSPDFKQLWKSHSEGSVSCIAMDVFHDGSVYLIDAPGHLPGHTNLLARTDMGSIYLAGDACHDRGILRKERGISQWQDSTGHVCCIHADPKRTEETLELLRALERQGVEVILGHDVDWEMDPVNAHRFWGHAESEGRSKGQDNKAHSRQSEL